MHDIVKKTFSLYITQVVVHQSQIYAFRVHWQAGISKSRTQAIQMARSS